MVTDEPRTRLFTREQYYDMAEMGWFADGRVELMEGEIVQMSPQNSPHACSIQKATWLFSQIIPPDYRPRIQLPLALGAASDPEPDVAIVKDSPDHFAQEHPTTAVLVIEIAKASIGYDRNRKGSLYAKYGIADLWIVNLLEHVLEIYRDPVEAPGHFFGYRYSSKQVCGPGDTVTDLFMPGVQIKVSDLLP